MKLAELPFSHSDRVGTFAALAAMDIERVADTLNVVINSLDHERECACKAQVSASQLLDFIRPHMSALNLILFDLRKISEELNDLSERSDSEEASAHG